MINLSTENSVIHFELGINTFLHFPQNFSNGRIIFAERLWSPRCYWDLDNLWIFSHEFLRKFVTKFVCHRWISSLSNRTNFLQRPNWNLRFTFYPLTLLFDNVFEYKATEKYFANFLISECPRRINRSLQSAIERLNFCRFEVFGWICYFKYAIFFCKIFRSN